MNGTQIKNGVLGSLAGSLAAEAIAAQALAAGRDAMLLVPV